MLTQDFPFYLLRAEKNHVNKHAFSKRLWYTIFTVFMCSNWGFYFGDVECKGIIMVSRESQSSLLSCEISPLSPPPPHSAQWNLKLPPLSTEVLAGKISSYLST